MINYDINLDMKQLDGNLHTFIAETPFAKNGLPYAKNGLLDEDMY